MFSNTNYSEINASTPPVEEEKRSFTIYGLIIGILLFGTLIGVTIQQEGQNTVPTTTKVNTNIVQGSEVAVISQGIEFATSSYFCVVQKPNIVGVYVDIEEAKQKLDTIKSGSRMIAEVRNGSVVKDPHKCGGQNQGGGTSAGFNKWWANWYDINAMVANAQSSSLCMNGPQTTEKETPASTAWPSCWIDSYGRGVGEVLSECANGYEKNGALCYPKCQSGYYGVGPVCWQKCPSGWTDGGVFCHVWMHTYAGNNHSCPWYDKCGLTFAKGCTKCNGGYQNHGCFCTRPPKHFTKKSYGRGAGKPLICKSHLEQSGALCYPKCKNTFVGHGPVCWGTCPNSHSHNCGALMCTIDKAECKGKLKNLAKNMYLKWGMVKFTSIADELCIPKCGNQRHMACTALTTVTDALSVCPADLEACPKAFKCIKFLGKRANTFIKGLGQLFSGGLLKDFKSFFNGSDGIKGCIKSSSKWFKSDKQGCDVQKDGSFKEFAKCSVPMFKGFFLDDFTMPTLMVSISSSGVLGIIGGGTSFDVYFAFDGTIMFAYTKCNSLSTPDVGGGASVSIGLFGNKNDIKGESYVLAAGAGIPGFDFDINGEFTYSSDGERVIAMGANFGFGAGLELAPAAASCSNCETKVLGCHTTLKDIGLGYLM